MGVFLILKTDLNTTAACRALGAVILISGVSKLYGYFSNDLYRLAFQFDLALGALIGLLGGIMLLFPDRFTGGLSVAAGIYLAVDGLFAVQTSVEARQFGLHTWWVMLLCACLTGAMGAVLVAMQRGAHIAYDRFLGIGFLSDGLQNLCIAALTIHERKK